MINISERTPFTILYIILYCKTKGLLASLRLFWRTTPPSQNEACLQTEQKSGHDLTLHVSPILQSLIKKSLWFIFDSAVSQTILLPILPPTVLLYWVCYVNKSKCPWLTYWKEKHLLPCNAQHGIKYLLLCHLELQFISRRCDKIRHQSYSLTFHHCSFLIPSSFSTNLSNWVNLDKQLQCISWHWQTKLRSKNLTIVSTLL